MTKQKIEKGNKLIRQFCDWYIYAIVNQEGYYISLGVSRIEFSSLCGAQEFLKEKFLDNKGYHIQKISTDIPYEKSWTCLMAVVEKIESIIGHAIRIDNHIELEWWYSKKPTITYSQGSDPKSKWTEKRKPFDSIGGTFYQLHGYYLKGLKFKPKKEEIAKDKREAVWNVCVRWIEWYNKNVKNKD